MPHPAIQLRNINRFLYALYDSPRQLSDLLREAGLNEHSIHQLRQNYLDQYIGKLAAGWKPIFEAVMAERQVDIVIRYYGLSDEPPTTLQQLGDEYHVSRERIRQLRESAVKRLQQSDPKHKLEQLLRDAAQEVLKASAT